jgi:ubiquitin-protein ligase
MAGPKLNKDLFTDINRLKLLNTSTANPKFILDKSPFNDDGDQEEAGASASPKDIIIIGRILPESEIYREGAYQIEMKLLPTFPFDPPDVRFLTPIYHPNVGKDGKKKTKISLV